MFKYDQHLDISEVPDERLYISYNNIHKLCQKGAQELKDADSVPDIIIAIGGGGFIPARILRSFLKEKHGKNIPIQAIGLSLYEDMGNGDEGKIGKEVVRTQWLDFSSLDTHMLVGKKLLIVDEVDDTRTTLHYAYTELLKDIKLQQEQLNKEDEKIDIGIFVLHNKDKIKKAQLPAEIMESGKYVAASTVKDEWIVYPWDAEDIDLHSRFSQIQGYV